MQSACAHLLVCQSTTASILPKSFLLRPLTLGKGSADADNLTTPKKPENGIAQTKIPASGGEDRKKIFTKFFIADQPLPRRDTLLHRR